MYLTFRQAIISVALYFSSTTLLQSLCRRIFLPRVAWQTSLLWGAPPAVSAELGAALAECAGDSSPHLPQQMFWRLRALLEQSLLDS